jgi:hypothetical protein
MEARQHSLKRFSVTKCSIVRLAVIVITLTFCSVDAQGKNNGDHLSAGGVLSGDSADYLQSGDGRYRLVMQADCNLVLYKNHHVIWTPHTNGRGSHCQAEMQGDGNFVVYSYRGGRKTPLWYSQTNGHGGSYVIAQNDGNLVVYQGRAALWNSGTRLPEPSSQPVSGHPAVLNPGESLLGAQNDYLQAPGPGTNITLRMQPDCNLVLYQGTAVLWASYTQGKDTECTAIMQLDGNLVIYDGGGAPQWDSQTNGRNGASLHVDQGYAAIYFGNQQVWSSEARTTGPTGPSGAPCTPSSSQPCPCAVLDCSGGPSPFPSFPPPPSPPPPPSLPPGFLSGNSRLLEHLVRGDSCCIGFVCREATVVEDHVCVLPATRDQVQRDNAAAASRRQPEVAPMVLTLVGRVMSRRGATSTDHVFVTKEVRQQTASENSMAVLRRVSK